MLNSLHPEKQAGGYTKLDGTIEFYSRINAIMHQDMSVLNFGAGRGAWLEQDQCEYRRHLRQLKGKVKFVAAYDVDEAVLENTDCDERQVGKIGDQLPFASETFDLIISDWVFEHIQEVDFIVSELDRVLKPGGWICSRTPNRWGYVAIISSLIPQNRHAKILSKLQPKRLEKDIFPTKYLLNTRTALRGAFSKYGYLDCSYFYDGEPRYAAQSKIIYFVSLIVNRLTPERFKAFLMIFLKKNT